MYKRQTGNGVNQTVTTESNGEIQIDNLAPGTYTVTEQPLDLYETPKSQTVTVVSGQTATVTLSLIHISAEVSSQGKSIYAYDPKSAVAEAYKAFTKEVMEIGRTKERFYTPDAR